MCQENNENLINVIKLVSLTDEKFFIPINNYIKENFIKISNGLVSVSKDIIDITNGGIQMYRYSDGNYIYEKNSSNKTKIDYFITIELIFESDEDDDNYEFFINQYVIKYNDMFNYLQENNIEYRICQQTGFLLIDENELERFIKAIQLSLDNKFKKDIFEFILKHGGKEE